MAIQKGHRFTTEFADAFPQGLVLMGELAPENEYQSVFRSTDFRPVGSAAKPHQAGKSAGGESTAYEAA